MSTFIRGSRVGAGPTGLDERGQLEPRQTISFYCANAHRSTPSFAHDAEVPEQWDCPRCGLPAGRDETAPPPAVRVAPYKTHLAYVQERRSEADGDALLAEALARRRKARSR